MSSASQSFFFVPILSPSARFAMFTLLVDETWYPGSIYPRSDLFFVLVLSPFLPQLILFFSFVPLAPVVPGPDNFIRRKRPIIQLIFSMCAKISVFAQVTVNMHTLGTSK